MASPRPRRSTSASRSPSHPRRGGDARGAAQGAFGLQPVANPKRAKTRQQYVLRRMQELRLHQRRRSAREAQNAPLKRDRAARTFAVHAEFVAEMARQVDLRALRRRGLYARHHRLYHDPPRDQEAAYAAVRKGVHRLRPAPRLPRPRRLRRLPATRPSRTGARSTRSRRIADSDDIADRGRARRQRPKQVKAVLAQRRAGQKSTGDGLKFAARALATRRRRTSSIRRGAIIRVLQRRQGHWRDHPAAAGRGGLRVGATRATARSARWSAASTSTATSSTT